MYNKKGGAYVLKEKFLQFATELYRRFRGHKITFAAGQIAFFFILSLFPFLIFTNSLIASINIPPQVAIDFLRPFFPETVVSYVVGYLDFVNSQSSTPLLSLGIAIALFSSSKSVRSLAYSFNLAYDTESNKPFFIEILFSMFFIFISALIFTAFIVVVALGNDFLFNVLADMNINIGFLDIIAIWRWITMGVLLFLSISLAYKFLPSEKIPFAETLPGTLFSLGGFLLLTLGFSFYVNHIVSRSFIYGSVGAVVLLMLWMYFAGIILMLGAEINKIFSDSKKH